MSTCGVSSCRYKSKKFGVCGVHKKFAYTDNNLEFVNAIDKYRRMAMEYNSEALKLKERGINLLGIQHYWDFNLCKKREKSLPPHFEKIGKIMDEKLDFIKHLQTKYDLYLVSNATSIVDHQVCDRGCRCSLCSLK